METIKIKSSHPPSQGEFIVINRADFDPEKHEPFEQSDAASLPTGEPMANQANQSTEPARGRGRPSKNQEQ